MFTRAWLRWCRNIQIKKLIKLVIWLFINVGFGAVPLILEAICRGFAEKPRNSITEYIPELTFLSVMTGVGVMNDLRLVPKDHEFKEHFEAVLLFYIIATLIGSAFLGMYFWDTIVGPPHEHSLHEMFQWSRGIAAIYVVLCVVAEAAYLNKVST